MVLFEIFTLNLNYDFIYSSHTLEHMENVEIALSNWIRLLRKGGNLILYIPDRDLYEKKLDFFTYSYSINLFFNRPFLALSMVRYF